MAGNKFDGLKGEHAAFCYSPAETKKVNKATGQQITPQAEIIHIGEGSPAAETQWNRAFDAALAGNKNSGAIGGMAEHIDRKCKADDYHGVSIIVDSKIDQREIEARLKQKGRMKGPGD